MIFNVSRSVVIVLISLEHNEAYDSKIRFTAYLLSMNCTTELLRKTLKRESFLCEIGDESD